MWVRSVLPLCPLPTVSARGRVQGNHPAAASSLLISLHQKAHSLSASGNSDDAKCLLRSTHLPRPASGSRTWCQWGVAQQQQRDSAHWPIVLWSIRHIQPGSLKWKCHSTTLRHRLPSSPLPRALLALAPDGRQQLYEFGPSTSSQWQIMAPL